MESVNEERVWQLLHELQQREISHVLRNDIRVLKRFLQKLFSKKLKPKDLSDSFAERSNQKLSTYCQSTPLPPSPPPPLSPLQSSSQSSELFKTKISSQRLIFVGQKAQEIRQLTVKSDESGSRLIVVGPKNIKIKKSNRNNCGVVKREFN
ncbi:unnamed protein product [Litomosoides sigmodontis]|uniref:Uncharacterized protein n=1 Tax=Litomosoides sigmodontis TaxID=42156 RepID=A0A3P6TNF3_LITSI|nr:unnamed protein product [Litomosoides sigmodontis]